ncbi:regulatory protein RecX [Quadrisphaera sp. DSM 44207]|uniref:regulatory protein RecX n=1 Tax=Quadrisphaera sp. DSM 44207 TaxID=1881057 RepID=UPI00089143C4|nr:regulatory protein RecX [Quadrisphaera sp. DSM 44207]SDQ33782.1 regulatory protein [Quadrisphaera sp. DSM 44207]
MPRPAPEPPEDDARRGGETAADADPHAVARAIALRQLTAAPRSRVELERAMARKGVPQDVAAQVLDRFVEVQLVDDEAYAAMLVRSRHATRHLARRGLAHELRSKGIDPQTAERALQQVDADDEEAAARALVARRLPATARLEPEVRLRRLAGVLARKGYPQGLAVRVVREALAAEGADEDALGGHPGPLDD